MSEAIEPNAIEQLAHEATSVIVGALAPDGVMSVAMCMDLLSATAAHLVLRLGRDETARALHDFATGIEKRENPFNG